MIKSSAPRASLEYATIGCSTASATPMAMVATILLQKSEGGALGIGGGGGAGGMMTPRGAADVLTRTTKWLAVAFLGLTLALSWLAQKRSDELTAADLAQEAVDESGAQQLPTIPTSEDN